MSAISQYPQISKFADDDLLVVYGTSTNDTKRANKSLIKPSDLLGYDGSYTGLSGTITDYTTLPKKVFGFGGDVVLNFSPVPTETFSFTVLNASSVVGQKITSGGNTFIRSVDGSALRILPRTLTTIICVGEYPGFPGTCYLIGLCYADNVGI